MTINFNRTQHLLFGLRISYQKDGDFEANVDRTGKIYLFFGIRTFIN